MDKIGDKSFRCNLAFLKHDVKQCFINFCVSGSHDNWLTPTIIYSRIDLSARTDVCRAVFTFIEF